MSSEASLTEEDIAVSAVLPCLNEARTLPLCIKKIQEAFKARGLSGEIVVADNGSTDDSVDIAKSFGARVVIERRKGYGSALMAGIHHARGKVIVMADADDSYDWSSLGDFVDAINQGFDLVMGNRFKGGIAPGAMPPLHRYLGNPVLSTLARWLYQIPVGDFHCGMRAFTKDAANRMALRTPGMEFATEMVVNAAHAGLKITEIPTRLYPDKRDRPPHLRSFRDGWRHLRFMVTYAPDALYLIPGLMLLVAGLSGMSLLVGGPASLFGFHLGIHFLALFSLLTLLGANVVGFGVFAKVLNARRCAIPRDSAFGKLLQMFSLERGLITGLAMVAAGAAVNFYIFSEWLARGGSSMPETVHVAFVAATVIVLGINVLFGSFLLYMARSAD